MGISISIENLKHYRAWLEQMMYAEDEEQMRWHEYLQELRDDKARSKLAEDMYIMMSCPVCGDDCVIEADWADCGSCQIRWNIEEEDDGFIYLEAEDAEDYGVENVWMAESFRDWANDELRTHGKDVSFEKWVQEEYEDEPAHRHADGQLSFIRWAKDEMKEQHHNAEEFCSECGYSSKKDAETFMAETESGTQVFNSCWKCGSGQHLYEIKRYPASPSEISGIGAPPEQASPDWEAGRPIQSS